MRGYAHSKVAIIHRTFHPQMDFSYVRTRSDNNRHKLYHRVRTRRTGQSSTSQ